MFDEIGVLISPSRRPGRGNRDCKLATSYYPVIFAGCLPRMTEADTDSVTLVGVELLSGERVYHLAGLGGSSDALELAYWLGVDDCLPRQAVVRTKELPGWSDKAHTIRITATLRLLNYGMPTVSSSCFSLTPYPVRLASFLASVIELHPDGAHCGGDPPKVERGGWSSSSGAGCRTLDRGAAWISPYSHG